MFGWFCWGRCLEDLSSCLKFACLQELYDFVVPAERDCPVFFWVDISQSKQISRKSCTHFRPMSIRLIPSSPAASKWRHHFRKLQAWFREKKQRKQRTSCQVWQPFRCQPAGRCCPWIRQEALKNHDSCMVDVSNTLRQTQEKEEQITEDQRRSRSRWHVYFSFQSRGDFS